MRGQDDAHNPFVLEHELRDALARFERGEGKASDKSAYVRAWFAPQAREDLLRFRSLAGDYEHADVLRIVLARAARSARRTTHFDLDFPKPRRSSPTGATSTSASAGRSSTRRPLRAPLHARHADAAEGVRARADEARREVLHGDARELELPGPFDAVVTSPPYPGLIDYHEQHRYAYELLGPRRPASARSARPRGGRRRRRSSRTSTASCACSASCADVLKPRGRFVIVVNDRRELYPEILERAGPRARAALPAAREPPHRPARRRVLRRRARRRRP